MKRLFAWLLAFVLVLSPMTCLAASSAFTRINLAVDNETPFVYSPDPTNIYDPENVARWCDWYGHPYTEFMRYCGASPIRFVQTEVGDLFYTVISGKDYKLYYLFLEPTPLQNDYMVDYSLSGYCDIRYDSSLAHIVLPQDLPSVILGDKIPFRYTLEAFSAEDIARNNASKWERYNELCKKYELPSLAIGENGVQAYYRCLQTQAFDVIEEYYAWHGFYHYDLIIRNDGTGVLHFQHFLFDAETIRDKCEKWELTSREIDAFQQLIHDVNFKDIPTWNPEEFFGFDGETTFVYGSEENHLISMWQSDSERYGIYRIRIAMEAMVEAKMNP